MARAVDVVTGPGLAEVRRPASPSAPQPARGSAERNENRIEALTPEGFFTVRHPVGGGFAPNVSVNNFSELRTSVKYACLLLVFTQENSDIDR